MGYGGPQFDGRRTMPAGGFVAVYGTARLGDGVDGYGTARHNDLQRGRGTHNSYEPDTPAPPPPNRLFSSHPEHYGSRGSGEDFQRHSIGYGNHDQYRAIPAIQGPPDNPPQTQGRGPYHSNQHRTSSGGPGGAPPGSAWRSEPLPSHAYKPVQAPWQYDGGATQPVLLGGGGAPAVSTRGQVFAPTVYGGGAHNVQPRWSALAGPEYGGPPGVGNENEFSQRGGGDWMADTGSQWRGQGVPSAGRVGGGGHSPVGPGGASGAGIDSWQSGQLSSNQERDSGWQRREGPTEFTRDAPPEFRKDVNEFRRDGPDFRRDTAPEFRRDGPELKMEGLDYRKDGPEFRREGLAYRREGPEFRRDGPDYKRDDQRREGLELRSSLISAPVEVAGGGHVQVGYGMEYGMARVMGGGREFAGSTRLVSGRKEEVASVEKARGSSLVGRTGGPDGVSATGERMRSSPLVKSSLDTHNGAEDERAERPRSKLMSRLPSSGPMEEQYQELEAERDRQGHEDLPPGKTAEGDYAESEAEDGRRKERPRLHLQPRTKPVEKSTINEKDGSEQSRRSLFGGAAPRELVLKGRGLNETQILNIEEEKASAAPRTPVSTAERAKEKDRDSSRSNPGQWERSNSGGRSAGPDRALPPPAPPLGERGFPGSSGGGTGAGWQGPRTPDTSGSQRRDVDRVDSWRKREEPQGTVPGMGPGGVGIPSALVDPTPPSSSRAAAAPPGPAYSAPIASPLELAQAFSRSVLVSAPGPGRGRALTAAGPESRKKPLSSTQPPLGTPDPYTNPGPTSGPPPKDAVPFSRLTASTPPPPPDRAYGHGREVAGRGELWEEDRGAHTWQQGSSSVGHADDWEDDHYANNSNNSTNNTDPRASRSWGETGGRTGDRDMFHGMGGSSGRREEAY